jgi:hypothetical protein
VVSTVAAVATNIINEWRMLTVPSTRPVVRS